MAEWFTTLSRSYPGGANRTLEEFKIILNWGRSSGLLPEKMPDPSAALRKNKRPPRGRLVTARQLKALGRVIGEAEPQQRDAADAVELILLTGCRSGEILRLTWAEVEPDRIALKRTKTGPRDVMLTDPARAVLERRRRQRTRSPFVFPSKRKRGTPVGSIRHAWRALRSQAGLPNDIRLHDLRHTYASHAIMAGETLDRTGALLGHRDPTSIERYAHLADGYLLKAARRVCNEVEALMEGEATAARGGGLPRTGVNAGYQSLLVKRCETPKGQVLGQSCRRPKVGFGTYCMGLTG